MISILDYWKNTVTVRLGDLKFWGDGNDGKWGDKKPIIIDSNNWIIDGNHRIYKLLNEKGPDYKVELLQSSLPSWVILLVLTVTVFVTWVSDKAKALYSKGG